MIHSYCRASHPESLAWCRVMASAGLPVTATLSSLKAEKRQMFEAAARKQTQVQEENDKGTVLRDLSQFLPFYNNDEVGFFFL
jgi:hypothetical protein